MLYLVLNGSAYTSGISIYRVKVLVNDVFIEYFSHNLG